MKKRLLSATLAVVCAMGAYAVGVGDYIYSNTNRFKVTGTVAVTNGDFSSGVSGWTADDGKGVDETVWAATTVDGKTAVQSQQQTSEVGQGLSNVWQLPYGTYVYSYWAKSEGGLVTATTVGNNCALFYASSDGTTQDRVVSEAVSIGTEWTQVVDTIVVTTEQEYLVMQLTGMPTGTSFTDFEIYKVDEVYDVRIVERLITYAESLAADPNLQEGVDDFMGVIGMMKEMIQDPGMNESPDAMDGVITSFNEQFDVFMNANSGNTNSGDWTTHGYSNWNNINNATVVGSWKTVGTRWGFSPNDESLERPAGDGHVLTAGIQTSFDLGAIGVVVEREDLKPGKYFFSIEAQAVAAANKAAPYGADHTKLIAGPSIYVGSDTLVMRPATEVELANVAAGIDTKKYAEQEDALNGYYWKRYYYIGEILESDTIVRAGFIFPGYDDKRGGRYSLRNPEFRMLGVTELQLSWESAVRSVNIQQEALKERLDNYKNDVAGLVWEQDSLDRAIVAAQAVYEASLAKVSSATESTVEVSDEGVGELKELQQSLLDQVNAMNRAKNWVTSQNAIQDDLKAVIASAQGSLDNPLNATANETLRAALNTAIAEAQALIDNISATNQYEEFSAAITKIQSAEESFSISAATRANPAAIVVENLDFSQSVNKPAEGLSNGWVFNHGADMRASQDWQIHDNRQTIMDEFIRTYEGWRGTSVGPCGKVSKTFTVTTPGLYEFRTQALAGDDSFGQYMGIAQTILDENEMPIDTIYKPNIRVFFGIDGRPDSLALSKCAPAAHLEYNIYSPMAYSVFFVKTGTDEQTVEIGLESLDNGATSGANFFGFGGNQIFYVGDEAKYIDDTKAELATAIADANAQIAAATESQAWITTKMKRYIADAQSATTAKGLQNAYLSLQEMAHLLQVTVTGIETITTDGDARKSAEGIYTISGVKLNAVTKPGLYIIDGKKVVIK